MSLKDRRKMVQDQRDLSIRRQCQLLGIGRSGLYYKPTATSDEQLAIMRRIDELHLQWPFYGSRKLSHALRAEGLAVNRKSVQRLMRLMGLESSAPKPKTSIPSPEHPCFPYLLKTLDICRPNQVWAADITYIPMARGFAYLVAIIDWYSRKVLAWRLSNSLDTDFCIEALQEALAGSAKPDIFNTDQGSQFTSEAFTQVLRNASITISMDGRGRCIDNVFVERVWRSLKYEEVFLNDYDDLVEARAGIGRYFDFYNHVRQHQALGYRTPDAVYQGLRSKAA
jgi:putative transposase